MPDSWRHDGKQGQGSTPDRPFLSLGWFHRLLQLAERRKARGQWGAPHWVKWISFSCIFAVARSCQKVEHACSSPAEIEPDQYLHDIETELAEMLNTLYLQNGDGDV